MVSFKAQGWCTFAGILAIVLLMTIAKYTETGR